MSIVSDYPTVCMRVLVMFAQRMRKLTSLAEDLSLRTVPERLAKLLIERAVSSADHRMTQREMAAQLGVVREVVARSLSRFEQQGWIRVRQGVIEILDPEALRQAAPERGSV